MGVIIAGVVVSAVIGKLIMEKKRELGYGRDTTDGLDNSSHVRNAMDRGD